MSRVFTRDDVLRLAPDAGSAKSGQDLAQIRKWVMLAGDENAIWGECQGSGAKPYQTQIDLSEPAFKCSCPSRKFPCKHGLGLLLIHAMSPESMVAAPRPAWVVQWLDSRQSRAERAAEKKATNLAQPPDPQAQAARLAKRLQKARAGISDLETWMRDLIRSGIATAPAKGFDFFDSQARRLVDAQTPGAARLVRQLGSVAASGTGWQKPFVESFAQLHLLTRAVDSLDRLPRPLQADVQSALGIAISSDELQLLPGVRDHWQVVAQEVELDDRLRSQRTWLFGVESRRTALVLEFAHGTTSLNASLSLGSQIEVELIFFPGTGPRAAVRSPQPVGSSIQQMHGYKSLDAALESYSSAVADCPWIERWCLPLQQITPTLESGRWWAIDSSGAALPILAVDDDGYTLLAVSGGNPVEVVVEYDGRTARPLSISSDGHWISLTANRLEATA